MFSIPGGYKSPNSNIRLEAIRLANAEWVFSGGRGIRYVDSTDNWDAFEDDFLVFDAYQERWISMQVLISELPEDSRKRLLF